MEEIRTEVDIDAPPEVVWEVLTDFPSYSQWNPFVVRASGDVREGARVRLRLKTPDRPAIPMLAKLTAVEPRRRLQWVGGLPGLFVGRHTFELYPRDAEEGDGTGTRFVHRERFSGALASFLVGPGVEQSYHDMNSALAERAAERTVGRSEIPAE